ncbi:MAG: HEPN domain-containing protein [Nanoarchaeota archaeon]|nr:HEPN domain-containing protein [Nanoarchaeota archaeon]
MGSIRWCCKQKDGIRLIEPNENLAAAYIKMAEDALGTMNRERNFNRTFAISACYYSMYYSFYSILMKIGIKCEIHSCTLELMKFAFSNFYSKEDVRILEKAFECRNISQYYVDKIVSEKDFNFIFSKAPYFVNKCKGILSKINEENTKQIRAKIENLNK